MNSITIKKKSPVFTKIAIRLRANSLAVAPKIQYNDSQVIADFELAKNCQKSLAALRGSKIKHLAEIWTKLKWAKIRRRKKNITKALT